MQNIQKGNKQDTVLVHGEKEKIDVRQFGFRKQRSTIQAISVLDKIKNCFNLL